MRAADHVINLGPEGGHRGGAVIACGTPEEIARTLESHTVRYLAEVLGYRRRFPPREQRICPLWSPSSATGPTGQTSISLFEGISRLPEAVYPGYRNGSQSL
jgi:hypothetical protein